MTTSTEAGREAWEFTPPTEDGYGVVSPVRSTTPWWTAIVITDDETAARVGPMLAAALAMHGACLALLPSAKAYLHEFNAGLSPVGREDLARRIAEAEAALAQSEGR